MAFIKKISLLLLLLPVFCDMYAQPGADSMLNFITRNKERSAFYVTINDTVLAAQNENKVMPLASTVKIIVAIEFAKQVGNHIIDENKRVAVSELNRYYIPNTDGGAHPEWLAFEKQNNHVRDDSIQLIDVARGMIMFSSNANTEYLMDLLGFDNVQNNIKLFGLKDHTRLYPLVSSLFLYQNPHNAKEEKVIKAIGELTDDVYCKTIFQIHDALKNDSAIKKKFRLRDLSMAMQKMWSDRLVAASAKTYVHLCGILNQRKFLDSNSYKVLSHVLEFLMENPINQKHYKHFGIKNGNTSFVLTEAFYATMQNGNRVEAAYFFNDLTEAENQKLQFWLNDMRLGLTLNDRFRKRIETVFMK